MELANAVLAWTLAVAGGLVSLYVISALWALKQYLEAKTVSEKMYHNVGRK